MGAVHAWSVRLRALARSLSPQQLVLFGFFSYLAVGLALLCLPPFQAVETGFLDNLFMATSALTTTGLTTISTGDSYTPAGQITLLVLMQLGGIGYMVVTSFVVLARRQDLGSVRQGILKAQFTLPADFGIGVFVWHLSIFTFVIEALAACILFLEFRAEGVEQPAWQAVFHSISAFCTAGFSLFNDSMTQFADNTTVSITLIALCYLGGIGFIVLTDAWICLRKPGRKLTFTTRVIVTMTAAVLAGGTALLYLEEPLLAELPPSQRLLAAAFQVCQASSTAGFNSVDIGRMGESGLLVLCVAMVIGSAPAGTGGGLKVTTVSALAAAAWSTLRGRACPTLLGHEIPVDRLNTAITNATLYLGTLAAGLYVLSLCDEHALLEQVFECASALGTVGLSMGITGTLGAGAKLVLVTLMFLGRVGPLTIGMALLARRTAPGSSAPQGELCL